MNRLFAAALGLALLACAPMAQAACPTQTGNTTGVDSSAMVALLQATCDRMDTQSTGGASAANQSTQITAEQAIQATVGAKADAKSSATDTTSVSVMQVLKEISAMAQAPAALPTTGADVAQTPTIQNASYASGNCMGGFQTVALGTTQSVLNQVALLSKGGLATAKQIYIFSANPSGSTCTDKSTFTIAAADVSKLLWTATITPAAPTGTTVTFGSATGLGLGIPSGGTIYAAIVETTTETPATTSDLVLNFSVF